MLSHKVLSLSETTHQLCEWHSGYTNFTTREAAYSGRIEISIWTWAGSRK